MQSTPNANSTRNPVKERTGMKQMMKQIELHSVRLLAGACGLFLALASAQGGVAQQPGAGRANQIASLAPSQPSALEATKDRAAARPEDQEEDALAPNKPGSEGIKVHGHWVLQVKNADGTLGERREFNNSLVPGGAYGGGDQLIAGLLSGNLAAGDPAIAFVPATPPGNSDASSYCNASIHTNSSCYLFETAAQSAFYGNAYGNSEPGLGTSFSFSPAQWVLSGNYTVPNGLTTVAMVQTLMFACAANNTATSFNPLRGNSNTRSSDISAKLCVVGFAGLVGTTGDQAILGTLTSTTLPNGPLTVTAGQIITVTVTLSFS